MKIRSTAKMIRPWILAGIVLVVGWGCFALLSRVQTELDTLLSL